MSLSALFVIISVVVVVTMIWLHHARVLAGRLPQRRPLPALDALRAALARSAETGRPVHLSPGASTFSASEGRRASVAELLAGLNLIGRATEQAAASGAPVSISSADAVAHLALRGLVRQSYRAAGQPQAFEPDRIELLAQEDGLAYATAIAARYRRESLEASVIAGAFGQEVLLATETGAQQALPQVVGSANPAALSLMTITSPHVLIGEEIFAAEAYLTTAPAPQARLLTHDTLRALLIWLFVLAFGYGLLRAVMG